MSWERQLITFYIFIWTEDLLVLYVGALTDKFGVLDSVPFSCQLTPVDVSGGQFVVWQ